MKESKVYFPRLERILATVGENIRLARLRRRLGTQKLSERAGISRSTLLLVEKGAPTVAIGSYLQVLFVLGLENDFLLLAKDDVLGRKIQTGIATGMYTAIFPSAGGPAVCSVGGITVYH